MSKLRLDRPFIEDNVADVIVASVGTDIFPSVKLAQAILETGWGKSYHAKPPVNNLYGIKANSAWTGKVVSSTTQEVINGVRQTFSGTGKLYPNRAAAIADGAHTQTLFRAYDTWYDSHKDHINFLKVNPRYTTHSVFSATTPQQQTQALQNAGYATGLSYANSLNTIIRDNGLEALDSMMRQPSTLAELNLMVQKKKETPIAPKTTEPTKQVEDGSLGLPSLPLPLEDGQKAGDQAPPITPPLKDRGTNPTSPPSPISDGRGGIMPSFLTSILTSILKLFK